MALFKRKSKARKAAIKAGFKNVKPVKRKGGKLVFPKGAEKVEIKEPGECLCALAAEAGFLDCSYLREINTHLAQKATLDVGDEVAIPEKRKKKTSDKDKSKIKAKRPNYPPPDVFFIKENGAGYPDPAPAPDDEGYDPHYPKADTLTELNISNYHVNLAGDGSGGDNFAAQDFYGYLEPSSRDPDHFKIQLYDNKEKTNELEVTLTAMRPVYKSEDQTIGTKTVKVVKLAGDYKERTSGNQQIDVKCQRVGSTNYFRSPYLRLVNSAAGVPNARKKQLLVVSDYFDDGANNVEKRFTEILDHKVRTAHKPAMCKKKLCEIVRELPLDSKYEVRVAVHVLSKNNVGVDANRLEKAREQVHKWMRRCLAQSHTRAHLMVLHTAPVPKNMITVSDGTGYHAEGKKAGSNAASRLTVEIGTATYTHIPRQGDSPQKTAREIKDLLQRADFKIKGPFRVRLKDLAPVRNRVSSPYEILVCDEDGKPVEVKRVASEESATGQNLRLTNDTNVDDFKTYSGFQTRDARNVFHNYKTKHFDMFICGDKLTHLKTGHLIYGLGPLGSYGGWDTDIGPVAFTDADAGDPAKKPYNPTHEMFHPLMHVFHTSTNGQKEIMKSSTSAADGVDSTKHVGDAPLAIRYTVAVWANTQKRLVLDGSEHEVEREIRPGYKVRKKIKDTPVTRFHRVARHYGYLGAPTAVRADGP